MYIIGFPYHTAEGMIMEDQLQQVRSWVRRGTLKQFHTHMSNKIVPHGYVAEMTDSSIRCYKVTKERKFPLVKPRENRQLVLTITVKEKQVQFSDADQEFVALLARLAK